MLPPPPGTFNNRVALITGGGTRTGLGKAMATTVSHLGATVALLSRFVLLWPLYFARSCLLVNPRGACARVTVVCQ